MKKEISLKDLVENYTVKATDSLKEEYLKNTVKVEQYIPLSEKIVHAEKIIKSSSYEVIKDEKGELKLSDNFKISSPLRHLFTVFVLIDLYTNIQMDENKKPDEYDLLNKNEMIESLFALIPEKEVKDFKAILDMTLNDFITNERDVQNYIANQIERFSDVFGRVIDPLAPIVDNFLQNLSNMNEEQIKKVNKKLNKMLKVK